MTIFTYNLTTFEVKQEEVDYVKNGRAIRKNCTFHKFCLDEVSAWMEVKNFLEKEIELREKRLNPLKELLTKINRLHTPNI